MERILEKEKYNIFVCSNNAGVFLSRWKTSNLKLKLIYFRLESDREKESVETLKPERFVWGYFFFDVSEMNGD